MGGGKGGGKAPATPDYAAAAQQTSQGNLEAARAAAGANRVSQQTPYGSLTYSHAGNDPDNGWTATQSLSPQQQQLLDKQNTIGSGLLNQTAMASSNPGVHGYDVTAPGNFQSGAPSTGFNPGQSYQDAMMSRLSPQIDRENQQSDAQLANQGIMPGSEAYNNAKTQLSQQHNDLLNSATVQGFNTGLAANQQAYNQNQAQYTVGNQAKAQGFQQSAYNQNQPLNMLNALKSGSQVQNPNYINPAQQATTTGPNYLGAAQSTYGSNLDSYNAKTGQGNANTAGLFNLAGLGMQAYGMFGG